MGTVVLLNYLLETSLYNIFDCNNEISSHDDLVQARAFLMEIFGKLETVMEKLDKNDESCIHPKLLQVIVHYMQGSLAWILNDFAQAENEFKVAMMNLPD